MNGNEYQNLAMRTCSIPYEKKNDRLLHAVFGLTSEAGEVAGIMQKVYQGHEFDKEHIKKELGDCLWMIAEACDALGFFYGRCYATQHRQAESPFRRVFTAERSLHRQTGDV